MSEDLNPYDPPESIESSPVVESVGRGTDGRKQRRPKFWLFATFVSSIMLGGLMTGGADRWMIVASLWVTASLLMVSWVRFQSRR
jgi:hypothetical protein